MDNSDSNEPEWPSEVAGLLDSQQRDALRSFFDSGREAIPYPWNGVEDELAEAPGVLLGFGSLLNPASARRSIPTTPPDGHPPALAFGLKRIFNYRMDDRTLANYGDERPEKERAALNGQGSSEPWDVINVRAIPLGREDVAPLRDRERGYDLVRAPYVDWPLSTGNVKLKQGWAFCAPQSGAESGYVDDTLAPFAPYLEVCLSGAMAVSDGFGQFFVNSTLMADGTPLRDWMKTKGP